MKKIIYFSINLPFIMGLSFFCFYFAMKSLIKLTYFQDTIAWTDSGSLDVSQTLAWHSGPQE